MSNPSKMEINFNNIVNTVIVAGILGTIGFQMNTNTKVAVMESEIKDLKEGVESLRDIKSEAVTYKEIETLIQPLTDQVRKNTTRLEERSGFMNQTTRDQIRMDNDINSNKKEIEDLKERLERIENKK